MAIEMKKTRVKMVKPLYLGMSILDISKTLIYEHGRQSKIVHADTDSFIINIKTEDVF